MTSLVRSQLKKLVKEREPKIDAKPRDISNFSCNIPTERSKKAESGEKVVQRKLASRLLSRLQN
jgi:hypothetical protein